tara:strand:+ start:233 stop:949 length:717 start_codon:yes stop_codon:yes gene_type:complete
MESFCFSIVVPIFNEEKNIKALFDEINLNLKKIEDDYEIIFVDDKSTDNSQNVIKELLKHRNVKSIVNHKNRGQSFSISSGIKNSTYSTIVTIDGDGQNNPKDIVKMINLYQSKNYKFLGGIRLNRKDNLVKKISSRIANSIRSKILNDECIDTGCGLKIFDKEVFLSLPYFDGIHRFLPALFKGFGSNVNFVNVDHRPRVFGKSKYGVLVRLVRGIFDIIRVLKILKNIQNNKTPLI